LVDRKEIVNIANLAALGLSKDEIGLYTSRLRRILEYFEKIGDLDGDEADRALPALGPESPLRPDRVEPSLETDALLRNTEFVSRTFFTVKKVIE